MGISANDVKSLRESTGAGMLDCKKALEEVGGDMTAAVEALRKKGLAKAAKKAGRLANEGMLGHYIEKLGRKACLVEVNCETDFVMKTDDFQNFVTRITETVRVQAPSGLEELLATNIGGKTVQVTLVELISKIGENIQIRRFERWDGKDQEVIGLYLHAGSKIGSLVGIVDPAGKITPDIAREIGMHVAAMQPQFIRAEEVPSAVLAKEKEIMLATMANGNQPAELKEKIVQGKIGKFYNEVCLENQVFVKDPDGKQSVGKWLKAISPNATIKRFVRFQVGA